MSTIFIYRSTVQVVNCVAEHPLILTLTLYTIVTYSEYSNYLDVY